MCNQAVGLIQGALEEAGIASVSLTLLESVTRKVLPPRALSVPFALGYPLGRPHDPTLQRRVILAALSLLEAKELPILQPLSEDAR